MKLISIADKRPYRVPGTQEWERHDAIPGPLAKVRRFVSDRTRRSHGVVSE